MQSTVDVLTIGEIVQVYNKEVPPPLAPPPQVFLSILRLIYLILKLNHVFM